MKFDLRRPCDNCPFRSDIRFPLEVERVEEIVEAITERDLTFACHKTTRFDPETGEHILGNPKEQHCAGTLIMLEKMERPNQLMRIAERCGNYDRTKLDMNYVPVYDDGDDMISGGAWVRGRMRVQTTTMQRTAERDRQTALKEANPPPLRKSRPAPRPKSRWPQPARAIAHSK
ncbi:hypothetical protein BjapCC829_21840 [Bradyrhizobium barranii]|uniref:Uncharacterized protein n=1 Tax=Bradyrhizobium barranii TaxID=2992140 RepID=A0ABY3QZG0_9BRAD|nr:hypothetical protein [Bradyrhizobium japonicum]UFW91033.1 hypothetical protein BjapCC829_21840 [Bradyrhizobium japonicum]